MSDLATLRESARELRAMQREAKDLWLRARSEAGITSYTDKKALSWVPIMVDQLARYEEWRDIAAAVKTVARDPRASPWKIRETCFRIAAERREREHAERMMAEREQGGARP